MIILPFQAPRYNEGMVIHFDVILTVLSGNKQLKPPNNSKFEIMKTRTMTKKSANCEKIMS